MRGEGKGAIRFDKKWSVPGPNEAFAHLTFAQRPKDSIYFTHHWAEYKATQQVRWGLLVQVKKKITEYVSYWYRLKDTDAEY